MTVRSGDGKTIAGGEFTQTVQGEEVTMRLTFRFVDGSIDDEMTTFRQQGTLRLVSNHHIQKGPFFSRPIDFTVEAASGTVTSRTTDKNGKTHVESKHMDLPADLANGFVGSVLLNVPHNTDRSKSGCWRRSGVAGWFGSGFHPRKSIRFSWQDKPLKQRCFVFIPIWVASRV